MCERGGGYLGLQWGVQWEAHNNDIGDCGELSFRTSKRKERARIEEGAHNDSAPFK